VLPRSDDRLRPQVAGCAQPARAGLHGRAPDEVWTADITYVATEEGWLYMAAIKDLFAGEIVGRSFGARMTTDLIVRALE
jgi:transposase InsO family protein